MVNGIFIKGKETVHFDFAENNVKSVTRRAATFIQYRCQIGHNFAHSENFSSIFGI